MMRRRPATRSRGRVDGGFSDAAMMDAFVDEKDHEIETSGYGFDEEREGFSSEEEDRKKKHKEKTIVSYGFLSALFWSVTGTLLLPLLIVDGIIRGDPRIRRREGFWPMYSPSRLHYAIKSVMNVIILTIILYATFWEFCRFTYASEVKDQHRVDFSYHKLKVYYYVPSVDHLKTFMADFKEINEKFPDAVIVDPLSAVCRRVYHHFVVLGLSLYLLKNFYKTWIKVVFILACGMFIFKSTGIPVLTKTNIFESTTITSIDPDWAMINEEVMIAIDGRNLRENGHVAWVPYWQCQNSQDIHNCSKVSAGVFNSGNVMAKFDKIDDYIPCFQPSDEENFVCFSKIRLRVKDKRSIPGWSLNKRQADQVDKESDIAAKKKFEDNIEKESKVAEKKQKVGMEKESKAEKNRRATTQAAKRSTATQT